VTAGARRGAGGLLRRGAHAVVAVLPQWITARVIVLGVLALAHLVVSRTHPAAAGTASRVHQGLLGWDAGWYEAIARSGYAVLGHPAYRFFPLVPLLTRALSVLPGVSIGTALLIVSNVSALVATALLFVLVRRETGDTHLAQRSVWLLSLVPPAFVLVMGYAEATLLVLTVGCFLCLRRAAGGTRPVWGGAAALGFAAALTRPLGVLLLVPVAVEALRWWGRAGRGGRAASVGAVLAPLAGMGAFLIWVGATTGDALLPLRVQTSAGHHGGLADPVQTLAHDATGVLHHHFGTALHVPWILLAVALAVVCLRRLPATYGAFSVAVLVTALSGTNFDSFERYALSAFPLVIAGATLTRGPRVERTVLALAGAGLAVYAALAFLNLSVP
jgi:hypothetical protein